MIGWRSHSIAPRRGGPALRSGLALAGTVLLLAGCRAPEALSAVDPDREKKVCFPTAGGERSGMEQTVLPPSDTVYGLTGQRVIRVDIEGRRALPEPVLRDALAMGPGATFDAASLDRDLHALAGLEVLSEIRVSAAAEGGGVVVRYHVAERPIVDRVFVAGEVPSETGTYFFPMAGDMHDPAATRRSASELEGRLVRLGHLDAAVRTHTRVAGEQRVDLCLAVDAGPAYHVRKLAFEGNQVLSDKEMRAALDEGLEKSDRGKLNAEGGLFRADLLEGERLFLDSAAYERGLLQWKAEPPEVKRTKLPNGEGAVDIVVRVHEGPVFHLAEVGFSGALGAPAATYQAFIDVHAGEVFARAKILAIIARADELHKQLGRVDLKVHPDVALVGDLAEVDLKVESAAQ